jgi:hypothetical protein
MEITRNNYETFIIDYFDGKLDAAEAAALKLFLGQNPDLQEEFESFDSISSDALEPIVFEGKKNLKRYIIPIGEEISEENYIKYCVEDMEVGLGGSLKAELHDFLEKNPSLKRDYKLFQLTRLVPEAIVYPDKESLKKTLVLPLYQRKTFITSVAAAIALLIIAASIYLTVPNNEPLRAIALKGSFDKQNINREVVPEKPIVIPERNNYADINFAQKEQPEQNKNQNNNLPQNRSIEHYRIDRMTSNPQLALIPNSVFHSENFDASYQTAYTDIMGFIAAKQEIKNNGNSNNNKESLGEFGMDLVNKVNGNEPEKKENSRFTIWDLAEIGVAGYNALSAKDVSVKHETDDEGKTVAFAIGNVGYSRKK